MYTNKKNYGLEHIDTINDITYFNKETILFENINSIGTVYSILPSNIRTNLYAENITLSSILTCNDIRIDELNIPNNTIIQQNVTGINFVTQNISMTGNIITNELVGNNINMDNITIGNNLYNSNNLTILSTIYTTNDITTNKLVNTNALIFDLKSDNITVTNYLYNNTNITINNNLTISSDIETATLNCEFVSCNSDISIQKNITGTNIICGNDCFTNIIKVNNNCVSNSMDLALVINKLNEYPDNETAISNSVPFNSLYRTADLVKVCIDTTNNIVLTGSSIITIFENETYVDEGAIIENNTDNYTLDIMGTVRYGLAGIYNIIYRAIDESGYIKMAKTRKIIINNLPIAINIIYISSINNINVIVKGIYNKMTLALSNNGNDIITETLLELPYISLSNTLNITATPYICTIKFKKADDTILRTQTFEFFI